MRIIQIISSFFNYMGTHFPPWKGDGHTTIQYIAAITTHTPRAIPIAGKKLTWRRATHSATKKEVRTIIPGILLFVRSNTALFPWDFVLKWSKKIAGSILIGKAQKMLASLVENRWAMRVVPPTTPAPTMNGRTSLMKILRPLFGIYL
jgi:hypothetical protein